jgi:hypothetical protein
MAGLWLGTAAQEIARKKADGPDKHKRGRRGGGMLAGSARYGRPFRPDMGDCASGSGFGGVIGLAGAITNFVVGLGTLRRYHFLQARDFLLERGNVFADGLSDVIDVRGHGYLLRLLSKEHEKPR